MKHRADLVLTAHHLNDQAETVLQRFLSGRLLTDAHAIVAFDADRKICRPLLEVSRSEIEAYASENCLSFVIDASNADVTFNRNKIRHELLPRLEADYNPNLTSSLAAFAERFGADEVYLDSQAQSSFASLKRPISIKSLRRVRPSLLWRVLRLVAEEQVGDVANKLGYQAYRKVAEYVLSESSAIAEADLGFGVHFGVAEDQIQFVISSNKRQQTRIEDEARQR